MSFETLKLQIPADRYRCHYVKAKVAVLRRTDGTLALVHGPRTLTEYTATGQPGASDRKAVA